MKDLLSKVPNFPGLLSAGNLDDVESRDRDLLATPVTLEDGKVALVPRAVKDHTLTQEQAEEYFKETKQHLGVFDSEESAKNYGLKMRNELGWAVPYDFGDNSTGVEVQKPTQITEEDINKLLS